MNDKNKKSLALLTPSGCLTADALMLFVSGSFKGEKLETAEKHIAECPLCADAADGLRMWQSDTNSGESLKEFQTRTDLINDRIKQRLHTHAIIESAKSQRLSHKTSVWFAAAAAIMLLMGIGFVFWIQNKNNAQLQAQKQLKEREAAFISQMPESLAYPPSNSQAILDVKYNSGKGPNTPPIVTIVNADLALASDSKRLGGKSEASTNDETEYTETREGVESDVFRDELETYKGQNARHSFTAKNSGGAMQKPETDEETNSVFINVQQMPSFPGGDAARIKYLARNLRYPSQAAENDIQGTVYVSFVIKTDGRITKVKLLHGIGGGCDEEALRVVLKMPQWKPGYLNGKKVDVLYHMPVHFKLQ